MAVEEWPDVGPFRQVFCDEESYEICCRLLPNNE